jgi:hypothetical protein
MSEALEITKAVTLDMTTHGIVRLYRLADLTTAIASEIINDLEEVEYLLPSTLLVLSEAEMRFAELNEKLIEAAVKAISIQELDLNE